jgi:hypothetical protein
LPKNEILALGSKGPITHAGPDLLLQDIDCCCCEYTEAHVANNAHALFKLQVEEKNKVTEEEAKELEKATRGQSTNSKWRQEREWRITASRY